MDRNLRSFKGRTIFIILVLAIAVTVSNAQTGDKLFNDNCAICHQLGQRLIGPNLAGVNERRPEEWLINFIKSSKTMIRNGDEKAVEIYEEFSRLEMPDHPNLTDENIRSILSYIKDKSSGLASTGNQNGTAQSSAQSSDQSSSGADMIHYTPEDIARGEKIFTGEIRLTNGGSSCFGCHDVKNNDRIIGGLIAKDLTQVYGRIGDAGIRSILKSPPFPVMTEAFRNHAITDQEINCLTAYLKDTDQRGITQQAGSGNHIFLIHSTAGFILLLALIGLIWNRRKKLSIKDSILKRQLRSI